jgi:hypothetical protein
MRPALKIAVIVLSIVLVVGIFVPLVAQIRGAAQRIGCSNNLKQILLAVQNYHDTYGKFPPGTRPSPDLPPEKRLSWLFEIVPFIEADNLYSTAKKDEPWDSPGNRFLSLTHGVYICPAGPSLRQGHSRGLTHYVGSAGIGIDAATYPKGDVRNGIFGYDRQVSIPEVTDGLSNTLVVLETALDNGPWPAGGPTTLRGFDPDDLPFIGIGRQFGGMHLWSPGFFDRRPPTCNCGMADGSVRNISYQCDPNTFSRAVTIAAGDGLGQEW